MAKKKVQNFKFSLQNGIGKLNNFILYNKIYCMNDQIDINDKIRKRVKKSI